MEINDYNIISPPIGVGLYSHVYLAFDANNKQYAIKAQSDLDMAKNEASIMEKYGYHPFLPVLYDYFIYAEKAYIVMSYFKGSKLGIDNFTKTGNIRSARIGIDVTLSLLNGLEYLHSNGIIHNDIKPKNILIDNQNPKKIMIIDYGLSKYFPDNKPALTQFSSDLYYTAQILIFSNGLVSETAINDLKLMDKDLKGVLYKAINPEYKKRYQSAAEFRTALEKFK